MANSFRYVAPGGSIDFLNDTGAELKSGESWNGNSLVGVVERDTPNGEYGAMKITGGPIFEGPLDTGAAVDYATGEAVYFNTSTGYIVKTDPTTNGYLIGYAVPGAGGTVGALEAADGCAAGNDAVVRFVLATPPAS